MQTLSALQKIRLAYHPKLPKILESLSKIQLTSIADSSALSSEKIQEIFPHLSLNHSSLEFKIAGSTPSDPLRVGVVLSGGQAPGGHNVIGGIFDALKILNPASRLFGFLGGPAGIIGGRVKEITADLVGSYRNQGGFDLLGSGRDKIESEAHLKAAEEAMRTWNLDGLVIIGGDDSNTNAAVLAEYFAEHQCPTTVIGVPKTIDGDLKNASIEISFGFDTACKTYSAIIGDIMRDTLSAKKSYYFIKLMGRSASHITLECALQTHPNLALISEDVLLKKRKLKDLIEEMCDIICNRSKEGKEYGVFLIPEGLIEFIPEVKTLIEELNTQLSKTAAFTEPSQYLSKASLECFEYLPESIKKQLLLERDPHGNVQVSKIETERLFIELLTQELKVKQTQGSYTGKFSAQPLFCGYEGRSCLPSNFDSQYCYALGMTAATLVNGKANGTMACIQNLDTDPEEWTPRGVPLISMMVLEKRHGTLKPVIKKSLVDLLGIPFKTFEKERQDWIFNDAYISPGPLQFFGPSELTDAITQTLQLELQ